MTGKEMDLRPISGAVFSPFSVPCIRCGKRIRSEADPDARADLNGKPFTDYYCGACVAELTVKP